MTNFNHVKAYILGLFVGGGRIDSDYFVIDLPFRKWGMDPLRMNVIAVDILTRICQSFNSSYNIDVTYEIGNNKWFIKPVGKISIRSIVKDLDSLGLPTNGFLLDTTDLNKAKQSLTKIHQESLLSGIFDTRASLTLTHRRFTESAPVVSLEIPGSTKNFKFVVQLCSWLTDLGSVTDQILYNHPNQHSSSDPNYKGWKKGFKIRFLVKSFLAKYSFALQAKAIDISKIESIQTKDEQIQCHLRTLKRPSPVTIHTDQNSTQLPEEIRGKVFLHYHHFCAFLGCTHAPKMQVLNIIKEHKKLIVFFPRLEKRKAVVLLEKLELIKNQFSPKETIQHLQIQLHNLLSEDTIKYFPGFNQGVAYLFAEILKGKRHSGPMQQIMNKNLRKNLTIHFIGKNISSPLIIENPINGRAFICSSINDTLNQMMIAKRIKVNQFNITVTNDERN